MKRIIVGLIVALSIVFTGCGDKTEKKEPVDLEKKEDSAQVTQADMTAGEEQTQGVDESGDDGVSPLSTEDGSVRTAGGVSTNGRRRYKQYADQPTADGGR